MLEFRSDVDDTIQCKINRDFTAKTHVWIKFNPDYFRVERVIMIEEDQKLTSFNGTGILLVSISKVCSQVPK